MRPTTPLKDLPVLFIAPGKTSAIDAKGKTVQKIRSNMCLPAVFILGALKESGFLVDFMDLTADGPGDYQLLGTNLLGYSLRMETLLERIEQTKPGCILLTSMFAFEQVMIDIIIDSIKSNFPNIIIILGGIHASIRPEWHYLESGPDYIVIGEGEHTIIHLLNELSKPYPDPNSVPGVAFRETDGTIVKTLPAAKIDTLSTPWALATVLQNPYGSNRYLEQFSRKAPIYVDHLLGEDLPSATFLGSRGCPRGCNYCSATPRTGKTIRHVGATFLFDQFMQMRQKFGVAAFANQADTFGVHPADQEFLQMVREYRKCSGDTAFVINNPNAFFLEQFFLKKAGRPLDIRLLELLRDAGFITITIAIETLTPRFNQKVDLDRITPDRVHELCSVIRAMGFKQDIYMMYGFPGQTADEFNIDLRFGEKLSETADLITWSALSLFPGTRLYEEYVMKPGREDEYRRILGEGYSAYFPRDEFNLSEVEGQYFRDAIAPFGQSWV